MFYWDIVNMQKAPLLVREAAEDICLIANEKWDYDDIKANQRLKKIFEKPEELLQELGNMKAVFGDKMLKQVTDAEEILRDVENSLEEISDYIGARSDYEKIASYERELESYGGKGIVEKIIELSLFVFKMAVYNFCKNGFKEALNKSLQQEQWERTIWCYSFDGVLNLFRAPELPGVAERLGIESDDNRDIFKARKKVRDQYYPCFVTFRGVMERDGYEELIECLQRAFENREIVEEVKNLEAGNFPIDFSGISPNSNGGGNKEIQNMRHLLDIMERNLEGRLTEQDKADLRNRAQEWSGDIERLVHMLTEVNN